MSWFSNISIRTKISLIVMSICFITLTFIAVAIILSSHSAAERALAQRMEIIAEAVSQNISAAVIFNDTEAAQDILRAYSAEKNIISAQVFDLDDNLIASYVNKQDISNKPPQLLNVLDIIYNQAHVGTLRISASSIEITHHVQDILPTILFVMAVSLFIAFLLAILFQRALSDPILQLHNLLREVAVKKDYSVRSDINSTDELGNLAQMFNIMLEEVQKRDQNLERVVHERTIELESLAERFKHRAFHDGLTGLPNRDFLDEKYFSGDFSKATRLSPFTLLLIDLDDFKNINDSKGHTFGDELLVSVSDVFKRSIRANDIVCRLGGDEFIIVLDGRMSNSAVAAMGKSIEKRLNDGVTVNGQLMSVSASIGCAFYPDNGNNLDTLKQCADIAMYAAKKLGKGQLCFYAEEMQTDVCQRQLVLNDFPKALKHQELLLYFQPKINYMNNELIGCEVLSRWLHPEQGLLEPGEFINYLEESRRICELDFYMLRKTLEFLVRFDRYGIAKGLKAAVNLSVHHFRSFHIVSVIKAQLQEFQLCPNRLEVEITEAALLENSDIANEVLTQIKSLGVHISLDDFGTGYSSLSYLRQLPIDTVKIDLSFIRNMLENERNEQIVKGMISLCQDLQLEILAEGVESIEQVKRLIKMGCNQMQGYYISKPLDESNFIKWCKLRQVVAS